MPVAFAVTYIEDGQPQLDIKSSWLAHQWAQWCRDDGCQAVEVRPIETWDEAVELRERANR